MALSVCIYLHNLSYTSGIAKVIPSSQSNIFFFFFFPPNLYSLAVLYSSGHCLLQLVMLDCQQAKGWLTEEMKSLSQ